MQINRISDQHGYITIESRHVIRTSHLTEHKSNIYNICHQFFYFLFLDESIFAKRIDVETALLREGLKGLQREWGIDPDSTPFWLCFRSKSELEPGTSWKLFWKARAEVVAFERKEQNVDLACAWHETRLNGMYLMEVVLAYLRYSLEMICITPCCSYCILETVVH